MMGIPIAAWIAGTLGYYARDLLAPGQQRPQQQPPQGPAYGPPPYPPPQSSPVPYAQHYGPPPGYPQPPGGPTMGPGFEPYPPPQYAPPPRRWASPFPLDAHMDERTDAAIARALTAADVATLRGFAQAIERVYPIGAGVLRTRAWHLEQSAQPPQGFAPPPSAAPAPQGPPNEHPPATREQAQNYAQLLNDIVAEGRADIAAAAPPPPAIAPEPAPAPKPRRRVVSVVSAEAPHANGAASSPAAASPSPDASPPATPGT